jgi:hypothetical protein
MTYQTLLEVTLTMVVLVQALVLLILFIVAVKAIQSRRRRDEVRDE